MRKMMLAISVVSAWFASEAGAFEYITSRGAGMGGTVILSEPSASILVSVPGGGIAAGEWQIETGYNRKYELADLEHLFLAAAYRWRAITSAVGLSQFGRSDLYTERTMKWSLAVQVDSLSIGASLSRMAVDIGNNYGQLRAATLGIGGSYRTRRLFLAVEADNLTSPKLHKQAVAIRPVYSFYSELKGKGSFSITARAAFEKREKPQWALGQRIRLSDGSAFFWGISAEPTEYGGGIELRVKAGSILYATSVHPVLGFSHTISVSYGSRTSTTKQDGDFDQTNRD